MYYSIKGKIIANEKNSIVVDNNVFGYEILISNPENYKIGEEVFLYLHEEFHQDYRYFAGFKTLEDKNAFRLLIKVQGIGPKNALTILSHVKTHDLLTAISNNDEEFVENIPTITAKQASQIMLDLKDYIAKSNKKETAQYKEIKEALKSLKFKVKEIDKVLPGIYLPNATNEEIIKEALRRLNYAKNN